MITPELAGKLVKYPKLVEWMRNVRYICFSFNDFASYKIGNTVSYIHITNVAADGNMAMTVLHEVAHFLQCKPEKITKINFGFNSKGSSRTALECEIETIAISFALAEYFDVDYSPDIRDIEMLVTPLAAWYNPTLTADEKETYLLSVSGFDHKPNELLNEFSKRELILADYYYAKNMGCKCHMSKYRY